MSHLGQRISALIDGELSDAERDRVLAHIAGCDACRQEAMALRALKQRMHSLGEAMVDAALTGRLMAMAMPPDGRPWTTRPPRGGSPAARMLTAGILASTVAGLGAAAFFAGGEQQAPGPRVTPAVDMFLVQHAIVTGDLPVTPVTGGTAGSSASAAPATGSGSGSVPAAVPASGIAGAAAAAAASRARAASRLYRTGTAAHGQVSTGQAGTGQAGTGQAGSIVLHGPQQPVPVAGVPVPAAAATVAASASPGP